MYRWLRVPLWLTILSLPTVSLMQTAPVTHVARQLLPEQTWQAARRWHLWHRSVWWRPPQPHPDFVLPMPEALALAHLAHLHWPVPRGTRVSSGFGPRVHPVLRWRTLHAGVDFAVPVGTPILASQAGRVDGAGRDRRSGVWMSIDHGGGVRTVYCHLSERRATLGQTVSLGQTIARSGNTGASTGPHLHWGVKVRGTAIDPLALR